MQRKICAIIAFLFSADLYAQSLNMDQIPLRESPVVKGIRTNPESLTARLKQGRVHLVVQLPAPADSVARAALRATGIELQEWLDGTRYYAVMAPGAAGQRATAAPGVTALFDLRPEDKISAYLREPAGAPWARSEWRGRQAVDVAVLLFSDASVSDAAAEARGRGWGVLAESEWQSRITVRLQWDELYELASLDSVRHLQPVMPPLVDYDNVWSAQLMEADKVIGAPDGVTGKGAQIGIWDSGTVAPHSDFTGRLLFLEPQYRSIHATHVAGTMAGDGTSDPALKGIAPASSIFSGTYNDDVFEKMRKAAQVNGLHVSQNSWGAGIGDSYGSCEMFGEYGQEERVVDELVTTENLSMVFAMGNPRDSGICSLTDRAGYYSAGIPAAGKNVIAVAAADRQSAMTTFSGFGPTRDGRLKPDITALGVDVRSVSPNGPLTASGTSMAAPAVSGMLALLVERFRVKQNEPKPKAALLKAILLNSARDVGNPGPDYVFGYGIPNAPAAIKAVDDRRYVLKKASAGEARQTITVPAGTGTLRVMLAWSDAPGSPESASSLVNDLDLSVAPGSGAAVLPLTLNPRNPAADAVPAVNRRDNVEQVVIQNPEPGDFTAIVTPFRLAEAEQEFALTWTFEPVATPPCTATLSQSELSAPETGGTFPIAITRANQCPPGEIQNPSDWVETSVPGPVQGSGVVKIRLQPNQTQMTRSTLVRIAGKDLRINQSGPCTVEPLAVSRDVPAVVEVKARLGMLDCLYSGSHAKLYTFEAKAGQTVSIELRSGDFDSYLELLGPNLSLVDYDDDSLGGSDARIPGATGMLKLTDSGTYTIVATSYYLLEGGFTLVVQFGGPQEAPPADANPKQILGCPYAGQGQLTDSSLANGRRGSLYHTDAYTLQAFAGQRLDISVSDAEFDSYLYLISPTGGVLALNDDDPAGPGSRITATLPLGGMWRIEVTSFAPFVSGTYRMQVTGCPPSPK
ncbi:MAG TPA: S8 family serine peptidase [Paludibaculum sp.]|jgi:subtilisin family serine protease